MNTFLILLVAFAPAFAGCLPVTGTKITARDLALADPRYASLPPDLTIGYPPTPGTQRVFAAAELSRIASANDLRLTAPTAEVCFEIALRQVSRDEAISAMRRSLPANADVNIMELAALGIPSGDLEFPVTGLDPAPPGSEGVQLWHGFVRYAGTRRAPFWARVLVTITYNAVFAVRDIQPGVPIDAGDLRIGTVRGPFRNEAPVLQIEDIKGRMVRSPVKADSLMALTLLSDPPAVRRGDSVRVEVRSGLARLHFDAVAESAARAGDIVELRNPLSGKVFRARLESGSKATLILGAGQKL